MQKVLLITFGLIAVSLLTACSLYKPARVLLPEQFGLICPTETICLEDISTLDQATTLRRDAITFVETNLGPFKTPPKVLFCSTAPCFAQFSNPLFAGVNIATSGMVINHIGWHDYIVRHEMIHHWQNENFGVVRASITLPRWYIEGMAYTLSLDPRTTLPHPTPQQQRDTYQTWIAAGNDWRHPPQ